MSCEVGALSESLPPELVVGFLREQIAKHRDRSPKLTDGAVTFAVTAKNGLTDYFTLFIIASDVALEQGVAPIDYEGPVVTLFGSAAAIAGITRATTADGIDVLGDRTLLKAVARCLGKGASMFAVRAKK